MAELSSTNELVSTNLNASKAMENATVDVHDNATILIDAPNVDLGQQLPQNRGATSDKSNLATVVALKSVDHAVSVVKEASIADSGQNIIATGDGDAAENLKLCKVNIVGQVNDEQGRLTTDKCTDLQAENCSNEEDNKSENWTLVAHKNAAGSHICSSTSRGNSPSHEKGEIENLKLPTRNVFAPLSVTGKRQQDHSMDTPQCEAPTPTHEVSSKSKTWAEQAEDEEYQNNGSEKESFQENKSPISGNNLNHNAPIFVPTSSGKIRNLMDTSIGSTQQHNEESVIAKKYESWTLASGLSPTNVYAIDSGEDFFDDDEEDNMLDICFDKVARDGDISPRQRRSGSNKIKKKTHGRQHSWDGKEIGEFVPRHLPMRLAKKNHMTVSIAPERFNKSKKK